MTDMTNPTDQPDERLDPQTDAGPDQDSQPPGDGIDGPAHTEDPAEGPR